MRGEIALSNPRVTRSSLLVFTKAVAVYIYHVSCRHFIQIHKILLRLLHSFTVIHINTDMHSQPA